MTRRRAMTSRQERLGIVVGDDWRHVALRSRIGRLDARATVTRIDDHLADSDGVVALIRLF
jgi:hypothetical protein